jgi:glycosyltransferase involved in cell wall biosynthesis
MRLHVIVPAYNEEEVLAQTLAKILAQRHIIDRVIIINDGSIDETGSVARSIAGEQPGSVVALEQSHKGFAETVKHGIEQVPEEDAFVVVMADGCDEVDLIEDMFQIVRERQADVVCASRYIRGGKRAGGNFIKAAGSRAVNAFFSVAMKGQCHDATNSFKMFKKACLHRVSLKSRGFEISLEMAIKAYKKGFRFREIPTRWADRKFGKSKFILFRDGIRYLGWIGYFLGGKA